MHADSFSHRKATARLRILNPDGTPAAQQQVRVRQTGHQFLFGCGAFDTVEIMKTQDEDRKTILQQSPPASCGRTTAKSRPGMRCIS